jgi:lysyl-tRNA synthetase class 2
MNLTEDMLRTLAENVMGSSVIRNTVKNADGEVIEEKFYDFGKKFERISMVDSILKYGNAVHGEKLDENILRNPEENFDALKAMAVAVGVKLSDASKVWGAGKYITEIFEEVAEHLLDQPTFITEYPGEVSPLARRNDDNPFSTDRFEFFVGGRELANGFSELNDAEDQAARFQNQVAGKDAGDDEAMHFDADYITALEYGLPPTAGEGIGIDRLVMLFTDSPTIKDVILFPHMRPQAD